MPQLNVIYCIKNLKYCLPAELRHRSDHSTEKLLKQIFNEFMGDCGIKLELNDVEYHLYTILHHSYGGITCINNDDMVHAYNIFKCICRSLQLWPEEQEILHI